MLWICTGCRTAYSVGAAACPQCGGLDHVDQGDEGALVGESGPELADLPKGAIVKPGKAVRGAQ